MQFVPPRADSYPYMLVNIGSGVSMLKVSGPGKWERVGGTSLGGATFRGVLSLLTPAKSFDEMLEMASRGDNKKVDMLVGDIYGTDYNKIGLKSTAIASSFGKVFRQNQETSHDTAEGSVPSHVESSGDAQFSDDADPITPDFDSADLSRALLYAISNNISQIAFLQSQIHGLSDIYFGGSFINGHPQTIERISVAINYWSKGEKEAYFLRHEGYLGAVGAFLQPEE
jgi:type II pantothenate kinase